MSTSGSKNTSIGDDRTKIGNTPSASVTAFRDPSIVNPTPSSENGIVASAAVKAANVSLGTGAARNKALKGGMSPSGLGPK